MDFISIAGLRADGRRPLELRHTECVVGTCDRADCDGSATMAMGLSKVTAMVAGPSGMSMQRGEERSLPHVTCSILFAPFCGTVRRFRNRTDGRSLALSQSIETAVLQSVVADVLKQSQIEVSIVITEADGGIDSCAINAAMLAVADAGIPLKDLAASCTAGVIQGTHVLDLNHVEETLDCPSVFVTVQPSLNIIVSLRTQKRHTQTDFEQLLDIAMAGCTEVYARMQQALRKRLKQLAVSAGKIES